MEGFVRLLALVEGCKLTATDGVKCGEYAHECYGCVHRREVPGNAHIACSKPCARMSGDRHGINEGWFMYPKLFDPVWRTSECANYEPVAESNAVSHAVSGAVSHAA